MKKKWLLGFITGVMILTFCAGLSACIDPDFAGSGSTKSDDEIAQSAINTLNILYANGQESTPDSYKVIGQANVDGKMYTVNWSVSSESENYENYVSVGEMDSEAKVTINIARATVDIEYTLTASVTVNKTTKTASYKHKIPAKSSEDATTASLSFATADARVSQTAQQQVWKNNGITFTNDKASSSSNIIDSKNPVRLYKGSKVTIEFPGITKIDFHSEKNYEASGNYSASPYRTNLKDSLTAAFPEAEITEDEETNLIVLKLANPTDKVEFTCSAGQVRLFSIDVEGKEGGLSDAEKLTAAKETLKLEQINYFMVDTVTLPTEHDGATLTWELKGTSENVSVENGTLKVTSLPAAATEVTLVAHLKLNEETADKEVKIKVLPTPTLTGEGTEAKPYSASEAKAITKLVDADGFFSLAGAAKAVYIHGYVIDLVGDDKGVVWNSDYNNWTNVYIADSKTATKDDANSLLVYRIVADGTILAKEENALKVGAEITLVGYLQNYRGNTPEVAAYGSNNVTATKYTYVDNRTPAEKVADALKAVSATMTVSATGETPLPATTEPDVTFTWALKQGETLPDGTTFANNKLTVTKLPATDTTVKFVVTAKLTGATDQTKEISVTIKAEASESEDTYFEITPSNFNGTLAGLTTSDLEENTAHPEEFTIKPNGYIKTNSFGHRIAKVVTEVYGSYDNMKMYAATSADASKEVKSVVEKPENLREIITYTFESGTDDFYFVNPSTYSVQMYSIKIYYEGSGGGEDPQPSGTLELTRETLFAGITGTGYSPYNGAHTVGGAEVTTSNVLGTDNYYDGSSNLPFGFTVMQFKKTDGTLSLKGTFTKIVVVIATSYDYDSADKLTITAGSTTLTAGNHTEADANFSQGGKAWKFYTIEYDVTTTGEQTITFKGATHAVYVKSITLTGTASQGGTVEPEPTPGDALEAGDYNIVLRDETNDLVWYVTGAIGSKGGLVVDHDASKAATITVSIENGKYVLKIGAKYLEAYLNGTYKNMRLVDTPSKDAIEWKWNTAYQTFSATYTDETRYLGGNYYNNQVDNLYDGAVTLSKEMNFTGNNPVVIHYEPATGGEEPEPETGLTLTSESFSELDSTASSGYDKYEGTHTVNGYQVTLSDVMMGLEADYKVVQFKKNTGTLTLTGTFTKITVVLVSTNEYGEDTILTITAGTTKLTPSLKKTEETGKKDGEFDVKIYTIEYTVTTTGAQEFTLKAGSKATYASSILFDDGTATTPDPDPTPDPDLGNADFGSVTTEFPTTSIPQLKEKVPNQNDTTTESFYVLGAVKSFEDSSYYCNFHIYDAEGNDLYVYGLYKEDGSAIIDITTAKTLFDVDDIVVLYGTLKNYKGTAQIVNAWLVQVNNEAKTDVAKVLLAGIKLTTPVTEDFNLPTLDGKVSWAVTSGTGIKIENNVAKVTRSGADQTVVLTATATVGSKTATKAFTIVVSLQKEGYEEVVLTAATLLPDLSSAYGNSGNATIGGYAFSWIGMGNYGLLQMRTNSGTGTSSFWNTEAFKENISKVVFTWAAGKSLPTKQDVLKVEFANDATFTDAVSTTISFSEAKYELTVEGEYKYVRITHNNNGAVYLDEVKIICEAKSASAAASFVPVALPGKQF